jgi:methionine biosynthesis protein MetW
MRIYVWQALNRSSKTTFVERAKKAAEEGSATAHDPSSLLSVLDMLNEDDVQEMLDLGCGFGSLTRSIAEYLNICTFYGVDIDAQRLSVAKSRGVSTIKLNLNKDKLPFPDCSIDLVTSFGVIEHLVHYDNIISESFRVLRKRGHFIISMPNLGSYINRLALLFGYQPRDFEISSVRHFGVLPSYGGGWFGHIHSATLRAMRELLVDNGFRIVEVIASATPRTNRMVIRFADKLFSRMPSLSRRFIILSEKV